jgi:hypothetical protein
MPADLELEEFDRNITAIEDILEDGFNPQFKEVDVLGVVVHVDGAIARGFQAVQVCDGMFNFVSVHFWGGLSKFCVDNLIKAGNVLLFSNLQWRASSAQGNFFQSLANADKSLPAIPCLYVTEYTVISVDAKEKERSRMVKDLSLELKKAGHDFMDQAGQRLTQLTMRKPRILVSFYFLVGSKRAT